MSKFFPIAGCMLLAGIAGAIAQEDQTSEESVQLPPIEVRGAFPADGWVYARAAGTEFLSQLSAGATRAHLDNFLIFQDFVRAQYPEMAPPAGVAVTVVLCNNTEAFRQFGGEPDRVTGTLPDSDRFILIDVSQIYQVEKAIRRRWMEIQLSKLSEKEFPLWRQRAMRQILSDTLVSQDLVVIGFPQFFAGGSAAPGSNQFNLDHPLALGEVFAMTRDDLRRHDQQPNSVSWRFHSTATAFVHMCLFGARHQRFRAPYLKFVSRPTFEPGWENWFRECFRMDHQAMGRWIRDYAIDGSRMKYETRRYQFPPSPPIQVRPAQPAEVLRLLRESQRLLAKAATGKSP